MFLIGHGYAPRITVRDGNGDVAYTGPVIFLPEDQATFTSFGVVKAPDARPRQIGLEGLLYPTYLTVDGNPTSVFGDDRNPRISMLAYVGDLGMDSGDPQSVYVLDKDNAELLTKPDGKMFRVDLFKGETVELPDGAGSVTLEGVDPWVRVQVSRPPARVSRSRASYSRCWGCWARCSSGRAGCGSGPGVRTSRAKAHTGRGGRPRPFRRWRRRRRARRDRDRPAGRSPGRERRRRRDEHASGRR